RRPVPAPHKRRQSRRGAGRAPAAPPRPPICAGGARAPPPRPRDWSYRPPREVRQGALRSALSKFNKEGRLVVVDRFELGEIKTKALVKALATLKTQNKTLVVDAMANENLRLSIRNCKDHAFLPPDGVNVYDLPRPDPL